MSKMGYKEGLGLGKEGQGIVEPVAASNQRGRRGLGLIVEGLMGDGPVEWDADKEHIEIEEKVNWMEECTLPCLDITELRSWIREGTRKEKIDDETTFCDEEVLSAILKCKSVFDNLEYTDLNIENDTNNFYLIDGH